MHFWTGETLYSVEILKLLCFRQKDKCLTANIKKDKWGKCCTFMFDPSCLLLK